MNYKAIIFDMDGTIISTDDVWEQATRHMLKTKGFLSEQECHNIMPMLKGASVYSTCNFIKKTFNTSESVEELIEEKQRDLMLKRRNLTYESGGDCDCECYNCRNSPDHIDLLDEQINEIRAEEEELQKEVSRLREYYRTQTKEQPNA